MAISAIDPALAASLGFRKPEYTAVERERRWLCVDVPRTEIRETFDVVDLYVANTRLRLREMRPRDGGPPLFKLSRKADVDAHTRLITTIYLPHDEFAVLASTLQGTRLAKTRSRLHAPAGMTMSVDEFTGDLADLTLVEAEFDSEQALAAFSPPAFCGDEVTENIRFTGAWLANRERGG